MSTRKPRSRVSCHARPKGGVKLTVGLTQLCHTQPNNWAQLCHSTLISTLATGNAGGTGGLAIDEASCLPTLPIADGDDTDEIFLDAESWRLPQPPGQPQPARAMAVMDVMEGTPQLRPSNVAR